LFSRSFRKSDRLNLSLLRAVLAHDKLPDVAPQLAELRALLQRFIARIGKGTSMISLIRAGRAVMALAQAKASRDTSVHFAASGVIAVDRELVIL
jgi:hypothetical protein